MNWQIPTLFGQTDTAKTVLERVQETTLPGTAVPQSAIERPETGVTYWFPEQASTFAEGVDDLYMFIFWVSTIFFIAIVVAMVYLCLKYRRRGKEIVVEPSSSHNTNLEIAWSVLPSILLVPMFGGEPQVTLILAFRRMMQKKFWLLPAATTGCSPTQMATVRLSYI